MVLLFQNLTFSGLYLIILSSVAIRQDRRESENRKHPLWISLAFASFFTERTN